MSKVITFSQRFPSYHPRKGEPTFFVEKLLLSFINIGDISISKAVEIARELNLHSDFQDMYRIRKVDMPHKHHTIRSGHRFKKGDKFSPRTWSGKPYNSKQAFIAPDIEVANVFDFNAGCFGLS